MAFALFGSVGLACRLFRNLLFGLRLLGFLQLVALLRNLGELFTLLLLFDLSVEDGIQSYSFLRLLLFQSLRRLDLRWYIFP